MKKKLIDVTVAMAVYDGISDVEHFESAIESILNQTFINFEFVIISDGIKRDDLNNTIKEYCKKDQRIRLLVQEKNKGLAHALNKVILEMNDNILVRMDADDICHPDRLKLLVSFLQKNPTIDVVGSYIEEFSGAKNKHIVTYPTNHLQMKKMFLTRNPLAHPSVAFRKSFFNKAGIYPTFSLRNEDTLLWLSGFSSNAKFANLPEVLYSMRFDSAATERRTSVKKGFSDFIDRLRVIIDLNGKWWYGLKAFLVFIITISPFYGYIRRKTLTKKIFSSKYKALVISESNLPSCIFISFYWKARIGLYALLKVMDIKSGDEVILPAYTCVVVPNAILYLGAKPIYIDVSADSYNMGLKQVEAAITDRTKAIICQNTYGLSTDLEALTTLAKKHRLFTIEDCTHGFGGFYNNIPNGLSCDAAIYSTQWNKPFSTGIGGFAITNNNEIATRLKMLNTGLVSPSTKELLNLKMLYFVRNFLINDMTYWSLVQFYRWLSRHNLVVGSSSGGEINSIKMPEEYFKAFSDVQAKEGLRTLPKLKQDLIIRKETAKIYTNFLTKKGKNNVDEKWFANHSFLKYPLLVNRRSEFMLLAESNRIALGEWFTSPLHPVEDDLSDWQFDRKQYPVAEYLASHVVNLPTTPVDINKILLFLENHVDFIVDL